ncbi:MAG: metal-dependent hydrolase [Methanoregula sp.]|nr:metal-dependent hydrolase [Methanoregula sp.]
MITRHHLMLVLICSMIPCSAIVKVDPVLAVMVTIGAGLGAILPDIQMKRPRDSPLRMIAWGIVQAGRRICMPVICIVYLRCFNTPAKPDDKRLTHSVTGIFLYFLVLAAIAYVPVFLLQNKIPAYLFTGLLAGLLSGLLLHLAEDLCCRRGVLLFYPFSDIMIYGSIRPCDILDKRILGFHIYHAMVLFFFLIFLDAFHLPMVETITVAMLSIGICIATMVLQSEVRIGFSENQVSDTHEVITT